MDLILARHTPAAVAPGICHGRLDLPLAEPAAPAIAAVLAKFDAGGWRPARVSTSPLQRCRPLAAALAARHGAPLDVDARWAELDFGAWEGRPWDAIDRAESDPWAADPWRLAPPGGETYRALQRRVRQALAALAEASAALPCVAVVSHAGPMRAVVADVLGLPARRYPGVGLEPGGLVWLRWRSGSWRLEALNR